MKQTITKLLGSALTLLFLVPSVASATITATWDFAGNSPAGIQAATNYGANQEVYISSTQDGVDLYVNTGTSGKFSMNGGTSYIQMNPGTTVHVPVVSTKDVLKISFAGNSNKCTINGNNCSSTALETYNVIATDVSRGYVVLGVSDNSAYINSISIDLAYSLPVKPIVAWDWENDESIRSFDAIQKGGSKEAGSFIQTVNGVDYTLEVDCTEGGKFGPNNNVPQFTSGAKLRVPVTSTSDIVTIKRYGSANDSKKIVIRETDYSSLITSYTAVAEDVTQGYVEITSGCDYLYSVKLEKNEYFATATIGTYQWATFSNTLATDFTSLAGVVNAYQVKGNEGTAITKESVTTAAGSTGLLLNGEAGTYVIPLAATGTDLSSTNKLVAVTSATTVNAAESGYTNYVLSVADSKAVFKYINSTSANVGAGKAYLKLNISDPASAPFFLSLDFDSETTDLSEKVIVKSEKFASAPVYNLKGQRVMNPSKGLYIVIGKKVVLK